MRQRKLLPAPADGQIANIDGTLYRYTGVQNSWISVGRAVTGANVSVDQPGMVSPQLVDYLSQIKTRINGFRDLKLGNSRAYYWLVNSRDGLIKRSVESDSMRFEIDRSRLVYAIYNIASCRGPKGRTGIIGLQGGTGLPGPAEVDIVPVIDGSRLDFIANVPSPLDTPISIRISRNNSRLEILRYATGQLEYRHTNFNAEILDCTLTYNNQVLAGDITISGSWGQGWVVRARQVGPSGLPGTDGESFLIVNRSILADPVIRSAKAVSSLRAKSANLLYVTGYSASGFAVAHLSPAIAPSLLGDYNNDGIVSSADLDYIRANFGAFDLADLNNVRNNMGARAESDQGDPRGGLFAAVEPTILQSKPIRRWSFADALNNTEVLSLPEWLPDPACNSTVSMNWMANQSGLSVEIRESQAKRNTCCQEDFFFVPMAVVPTCQFSSSSSSSISSSSDSSSSSGSPQPSSSSGSPPPSSSSSSSSSYWQSSSSASPSSPGSSSSSSSEAGGSSSSSSSSSIGSSSSSGLSSSSSGMESSSSNSSSSSSSSSSSGNIICREENCCFSDQSTALVIWDITDSIPPDTQCAQDILAHGSVLCHYTGSPSGVCGYWRSDGDAINNSSEADQDMWGAYAYRRRSVTVGYHGGWGINVSIDVSDDLINWTISPTMPYVAMIIDADSTKCCGFPTMSIQGRIGGNYCMGLHYNVSVTIANNAACQTVYTTPANAMTVLPGEWGMATTGTIPLGGRRICCDGTGAASSLWPTIISIYDWDTDRYTWILVPACDENGYVMFASEAQTAYDAGLIDGNFGTWSETDDPYMLGIQAYADALLSWETGSIPANPCECRATATDNCPDNAPCPEARGVERLVVTEPAAVSNNLMCMECQNFNGNICEIQFPYGACSATWQKFLGTGRCPLGKW